MLYNYEHIAHLITGFNNGTLIEKEHDELNEWITANKRNQQLFEELSDPNRLREYLKQMEGYDDGESWDKIKEELPLTIIPARHLFPWKKIAVAASIILTLGVGAYFAFFNNTKKEGIAKLPEIKDVEAPKVTKAMITLADGRKVALDSLTMIVQGNVKVIKTSDGKIIYSLSTRGGQREAVYNTLTNPRGSKVIDVTMADGSQVWLNAGSSLTYPVAFVGRERKVTITGEAYFEVTHNPDMPFTVSKGETVVQVLGTHFNMNSYEDEASIKVTLLEGSVKVVKGSSSAIIKPGQQAQVSDGIKLENDIDLEQVMAWKNGIFSFKHTDIKSMMQQIARWYDVEVSYEGNIVGQTITGDISRNVNVSEVMKMLAFAGIHFTIDGRKIVLKP